MPLLLLLVLLWHGVGLAGSATSRWDLTIGGYVRFDMGYMNEDRHGYALYENLLDRYGTIYFYSGATRLNFLTKGPDAWGAKTSAFVEGDFNGVYAGSRRGAFALRHAFMALDWPETRLVIGHTFQKWGYLPTYANVILGPTDLSPFLKGHRQPMIRLEQRFGQDWGFSLAIMSPTNTLGSNRFSTNTGVVDSFTLSQMPFYEGTLGWSSNKFGNIGAWKMLFSLEGFYGQQKQVVTQYTGTSAAPTSLSFADRNLDSWGLAMKGFIPLIPERKGNKTGALSISGVLFTAQNPSWLQSRAYTANAYARPDDTGSVPPQDAGEPIPDFASPRVLGGWGQMSYYLTDSLFVNGWYGYMRNDLSSNYGLVQTSSGSYVNGRVVRNATQYIASICYDVNAAIRFAAEYSYYLIHYAAYGSIPDPAGPGVIPNALSKDRSDQAFRIAAWYFF